MENARILLKNIYSFLRQNADVLLLGAIMGFIMILPQVMFPIIIGDAYKGINYGNYGEDDISYYQKGREILEGHGLGNPTLQIGKENPDPHGVFIEYLILAPLRLFGLGNVLDIVVVHMFITFFGVMILVFAVMKLMQLLTNHRLFSIATACFMIGGYNLLLTAPIRVSPFSSYFNIYGRPTMPLLSGVFFFPFLIFLYKTIANPSRRNILITGILYGSLFYIYFYAWTFASAIFGVLFVWYMYCRDWNKLKAVAIAGGIGFGIGLYRLWRLAYFLSTDFGKQITFFSTSTGRELAAISKLSVVAILGLICVVWLSKRKKIVAPIEIPFLFSLPIAGFIAMNQQVLTNKLVQSMHYFFYFIIPLTIFVGFYSFFQILKLLNKTFYVRIVAMLVIGLVIFSVAREQVMATYDTVVIKTYAQQYGPIMDILRNDNTSGTVLISDYFLGHSVTIYTARDLFWGQAVFYFTPIQYIKNAIFVYSYLNTEARGNLKQFLYANNRDKKSLLPYEYKYLLKFQGDHAQLTFDQVEAYFSKYKDANYYGHLLRIKDPQAEQIHEEIIDDFAAEYDKLTENGPREIVSILRENDVEYILWDKLQSPNWDLSFLPKKEEVARSGNLILYRINY